MGLKLKTITVADQQVDIYNINDFPYYKFSDISTVEKGKKSFADCICTFDIETTSYTYKECKVLGTDFGFMYVWQFCIEGYVCCGRTWKEYENFINELKRNIGIESKCCMLVVYVHNLQFEFQFMRNFFRVDKVFCRDKRDVVYADIENVQYRCSYTLSNMGLEKFLEKTKGVTFNKLSGKKFNYSIKRFPDTELSEYEWAYSISDVLGLYEAIRSNLLDDTLCSIPMTSTGYVRREFRDACLESDGYKRKLLSMRLDEHTYTLCREASRGAIAGSNHIHTDEILEEVDSHDIKSSYPYQMSVKYFPASKFIKYTCDFGTDKFDKFRDNACCIIVWTCEDLKLKKWEAIPYISKAKCRAIEGFQCGNGKVYSAKKIGMCCTEIDLRIIEESYYFKNPKILEIWVAHRDLLPLPFRKTLLDMFQIKTELEDGDKYLYNKYKNKINSSFGMMLTDILHPEIVYVPNSTEPWREEKIENINNALKKYYYSYNTFLSYQHGVWVLAHGRDSLYQGMKIVGTDIVQVDTDSVKNLGDYRDEFSKLNKKIIEYAETLDIKPYAYNKKGEKVYLGIWEHEGEDNEYTYQTFKTLGAKKYAFTEDDGRMKITVSGLSKNSGEWFEQNGGMDKFENGTIVPSKISGRTASTYVDLDKVHTIIVDGHEITLGSNIAIKNVPYTLGMTGEWLMLILDGMINSDEEVPGDGAFKGWV